MASAAAACFTVFFSGLPTMLPEEPAVLTASPTKTAVSSVAGIKQVSKAPTKPSS